MDPATEKVMHYLGLSEEEFIESVEFVGQDCAKAATNKRYLFSLAFTTCNLLVFTSKKNNITILAHLSALSNPKYLIKNESIGNPPRKTVNIRETYKNKKQTHIFSLAGSRSCWYLSDIEHFLIDAGFQKRNIQSIELDIDKKRDVLLDAEEKKVYIFVRGVEKPFTFDIVKEKNIVPTFLRKLLKKI